MKGLNINISSCASQSSTAILSSTMELPSSPPSSSSSSPSPSPFSTFTPGSRAIDRHNPIITDERRSGSSCTNTPLRTPCTNNVLQQKPTTPTSVLNTPKFHQTTPKRRSNKLATLAKKTTTTSSKKINNNNAAKPPLSPSNDSTYITIDGDDDDGDDRSSRRRSFSKSSNLIMKASACANTRPGVDYISPPESSRYLLDDTSFLEVLSDFDPVLKLAPLDSTKNVNMKDNDEVEVGDNKFEDSKPPKSSSSSESPSDQVVVLRVSLHCRGCEKKMKKHLSRMPGVTSFNIDFAAKKVTVVGDVTPLGVLASISKVKTAKLWTPPAISSSSSQLNYSSRNNNIYAL